MALKQFDRAKRKTLAEVRFLNTGCSKMSNPVRAAAQSERWLGVRERHSPELAS
jgi:hypothetical protein